MLLRILAPLSAIWLLTSAQQYNPNQRSPYQQQPGQQQYPGQQYPNSQNNQYPQNRQMQPNQQINRQQPGYQQQPPNQYNQQQSRGQPGQPQQQLRGQQGLPQQQYGMQQGQNGQYQFNNGQSMQQMSRAALSTNPVRMTNSSDLGATITIQLRQYENQDFSLDADTTCACPVINCDFLRSNEQNNCQFSFMVVISSADQTVTMVQSDFYPFLSGTISQGNWTSAITLNVPTKPSAVDVFVQHLGAVIRKQTAQLLYFNNRLTLVDSFAIPLRGLDPTTGNGRVSTKISSTLQQGSSLSYDLTLQCLQGYMGTDCNLQCGVLGNSNGDTVLCRSTDDGQIQSCRYNSARTQVSNCYICYNGNYNSSSNTCMDSNSSPVNSNLVSHSYRTWTIVLAVLLTLALLLILCLIIAYIILRNREQDEYENSPAVFKPPAQTNGTNGTSNGYNGTTNRTTNADHEWSTAPSRQPLIGQNDDVYRTTTTTMTQQRQEHAV